MARPYEHRSDRDLRELGDQAVRIGGNAGRILQNDVDREMRLRSGDVSAGKATRRERSRAAELDRKGGVDSTRRRWI